MWRPFCQSVVYSVGVPIRIHALRQDCWKCIWSETHSSFFMVDWLCIFLQAEKILGSLGGIFSRKWKPKLMGTITGPLDTGGAILLLLTVTFSYQQMQVSCALTSNLQWWMHMVKAYSSWGLLWELQVRTSRDIVVMRQTGQPWGCTVVTAWWSQAIPWAPLGGFKNITNWG